MIQPRGILVEVSIGFVFGNLLWAITGDLISHRLTYVIERHGDVSPPHIAHRSSVEKKPRRDEAPHWPSHVHDRDQSVRCHVFNESSIENKL